MKTRSLYVPEATLTAWRGTTVYQYDPSNGALSEVSGYAPSGSAFVFYEVSVIARRGSYWLPTSPQNEVPAGWLENSFGGVDRLSVADGSDGFWLVAAGQTIMRPAKALFWIDEKTLAENRDYLPGDSVGEVVGSFPPMAPDTPKPTAPRSKCKSSSSTSYAVFERLRRGQ
jgi:hypothetical protein